MPEQNNRKKIIPLLSVGAIMIICYIFSVILIFSGRNKLLNLFGAPTPHEMFGGALTYAIFYGVFFCLTILFSFLKPKLVSLSAVLLLLFESAMLLLPAAHYAEQLGSRHAGLYLASLFSDRLALTLKSLSFLGFGVLLLIAVFSQRKTCRLLCIFTVFLAVAVFLLETVYMLSPSVHSEILSFGIKFPFSLIFDLFRLIALSLLPFLSLFAGETKKNI